MDNQKNRPYEIGYGKPPRKTQFKKGVSGNPRGRTKQVSTPRDAFIKVFNEPVRVTIGGQTRMIPGTEAIFWQMKKQFMEGNFKTFRAYVDLSLKYDVSNSDEVHPQLQGLFDALMKGPVDKKSQK